MQPIYIIDKQTVLSIINDVFENSKYSNSLAAFGYNTREDIEMVILDAYKDNDSIHVSKVCQVLSTFETGKAAAYANNGLGLIKTKIKQNRKSLNELG